MATVSNGAIRIIQGLKGKSGPDLAGRLKKANKKYGKENAKSIAIDNKKFKEAHGHYPKHDPSVGGRLKRGETVFI